MAIFTARRLIPILGSIAICLAVFFQTNIEEAIAALEAMSLLTLFVACLIALSEEVLVGPYKWRIVVGAVGPRLTFKEAVLIRLGSQPIRSVAPLKTGEAATVVYLNRVFGMSVATATSTSLFEKGVNVWAAIFLISVGLVLSGLSWVACATVLLMILPFIRSPWMGLAEWMSGKGKLGKFAAKLMDAFLLLSPRDLLAQLPLAILFTGLEVFNTWWILNQLGAQVPLEAALVVVPTSYFLNNIPITFLGIGMREGLFVVALSSWAPPHILLAGGLAVTFVEYIVPTLIGLLFLKPFLSRCSTAEQGVV